MQDSNDDLFCSKLLLNLGRFNSCESKMYRCCVYHAMTFILCYDHPPYSGGSRNSEKEGGLYTLMIMCDAIGVDGGVCF